MPVSNMSGREIDFAAGPYGAFEAAPIHYAQGLAHRLAPKGIHADTVSPGNTHSPGGVWARIERDNPSLYASALALDPMGRMWARPRRWRAPSCILASPAARFVGGTDPVVDGALTRGVQF